MFNTKENQVNRTQGSAPFSLQCGNCLPIKHLFARITLHNHAMYINVPISDLGCWLTRMSNYQYILHQLPLKVLDTLLTYLLAKVDWQAILAAVDFTGPMSFLLTNRIKTPKGNSMHVSEQYAATIETATSCSTKKFTADINGMQRYRNQTMKFLLWPQWIN